MLIDNGGEKTEVLQNGGKHEITDVLKCYRTKSLRWD